MCSTDLTKQVVITFSSFVPPLHSVNTCPLEDLSVVRDTPTPICCCYSNKCPVSYGAGQAVCDGACDHISEPGPWRFVLSRLFHLVTKSKSGAAAPVLALRQSGHNSASRKSLGCACLPSIVHPA